MTDIPAMMLWTDAYMADTSHLTTLEHGAYLLLMMAMWRAGGRLPDDDVRLARVVKLPLDKWRKMAPLIREFLTVKDGFVFQKRLKLELEIAQSRIDKSRKAGRAGGRAKALKYKKPTPSSATKTPVAEMYDCSANQNQNQLREKEELRSSKKPKRKSALDEGSELTERHIDAAKARGMSRSQAIEEWERFKNRHIAKGELMADWWRAWLTWCGNFKKFNPQTKPPNGATAGINGAMQFLKSVVENEQIYSREGVGTDLELLPVDGRKRIGNLFDDGA